MKISVVLPSFNRAKITARCIESLLGAQVVDFQICIIVVDDRSTDDTVAMVRTRFPTVVVLETLGDAYWSRTVNIGIRYAIANAANYVLVLNDDTTQEAHFISWLFKTARECPGSIVGGKILSMSRPGEIRFLGAYWSILRGGWHYPEMGALDSSCNRAPFDVDSINGNCLLVPSNVFLDVGTYDDQLMPHCYADTEFTVRAKRRGYRLLIEPRAIVWDDDSDLADKAAYASKASTIDLRQLFMGRRSPYNVTAIYTFYTRTAPNFAIGFAFFLYRMLRVSAKILQIRAGIFLFR